MSTSNSGKRKPSLNNPESPLDFADSFSGEEVLAFSKDSVSAGDDEEERSGVDELWVSEASCGSQS